MEQFEIKDDRGASLVFHEPRFGADGFFESYRACLMNDFLKADIEVDGRRYKGVSTGEEEFFSELAKSWRGWSGQKVFESLEHDLALAATSDQTGHIELQVTLTRFCHSTSTASACLMLYAGELEGIARHARMFFSQRATTTA